MQTVIPPGPATALPADESRHAALAALHDRNIDMAKGFAKMVEKAEPSFRSTAERFRALHGRHTDALGRMLSDLGLNADSDGTFMGKVHQAVVSIRAFFDEIDEDVMDQVRSGERALLQAYEEAIAENTAQGFVAKLREMQAEVQAELTATAHLD
jgi:uncharacterized protein (TIGR02284 family)